MSSVKFLILCALLFSVALSQEEGVTESPTSTPADNAADGNEKPKEMETVAEPTKKPMNCTEDDKNAIMEECKAPLVDLKSSVTTFSDLGKIEDPSIIWTDEKFCSAKEELGTFVECYVGKIEECHAKANMSDDLPDAKSTKEAVIYLCDEKDNLYKTKNASDFEECHNEKLPAARTCMSGYVVDNPASASDKCILNDRMVSCLVKVDECTDDAIFETYAGYFRPAHCAACSLLGTWSVMLLVMLMALFN